MASNKGRTGRAWQAVRAHIITTQRLCGICYKPVDKTRPYRLPNGRIDPWSKSVDHITPLAEGGRLLDPHNLQLTHLTCNTSEGGKLGHARQQARNTNHSRTW